MVAAFERMDLPHCLVSRDLPGPFFCGFTRGMKQGEYIEVDGQLAIHHYASLNFTNPVIEIHAMQIRRLEIPVVGVIEKYDG